MTYVAKNQQKFPLQQCSAVTTYGIMTLLPHTCVNFVLISPVHSTMLLAWPLNWGETLKAISLASRGHRKVLRIPIVRTDYLIGSEGKRGVESLMATCLIPCAILKGYNERVPHVSILSAFERSQCHRNITATCAAAFLVPGGFVVLSLPRGEDGLRTLVPVVFGNRG